MSSDRLFILSGPSGVGKTTLCQAVAKKLHLYYSISTTTRPIRKGEKDGENYFFVSETKFQKAIKRGAFLEHAQVHGSYYGTRKDLVEQHLQKGQGVILDLDPQGALQIKKIFPLAVLIFIKPPNLDSLKARIASRRTDSPETIARRMANATQELAFEQHYDHVIVNHELSETVQVVADIIESYRKNG
ncbi:MAG: guanylate kinase [Deltaproteobacteria bacterium]|nr:guanylate kinase [Deltaproteobacteria bacterium]